MHLVRIDGKLPYDTHWEGHLLGEDATHKYLWLWHGFNIRAIAIPREDRGLVAYDYGWCYPRDADLVEQSFAAWNPDTQDEPLGWHKRALRPVRRAPGRDAEPHRNRPLCDHGKYLDDGCGNLGCPHHHGKN